jgi:hypothetical protein
MKSRLSPLSTTEFLKELHHSLWTELTINKGQRDEGWNCRDHALIVACLTQLLQRTAAAILHGRACFVQGPRQEVPPVGLNADPHSWSAIEGLGLIDLSPRLSTCSSENWAEWPYEGLFLNRCLPLGSADLRIAKTLPDFDNWVALATHRNASRTVVYWPQEYEQLTRGSVERSIQWSNSLLTEWLRDRYGESEPLHARAALYLYDFVSSEAPALSHLCREEAWDVIACRPGNAVFRLASRAGLR